MLNLIIKKTSMAEQRKKKIEGFTDLKTWQEANKLAQIIFSECKGTETNPLTEKLQTTVLSTTATIAKGFYKKAFEEKVKLYYQVLDTLVDLEDSFELVKTLKLFNEKTIDELDNQLITVRKMTFSLISKLKEIVEKSE